MKKFFFTILCCVPVLFVQAQTDLVKQWITDATALGGSPVVEEESAHYSRIRMADSCYIEVQNYGDSILVVQTVCAPVCSSCAHIYNKEWQLLREVRPTKECTFPLAAIRNGQLVWQDNTAQILDDEEKSGYNKEKTRL